MQLTSRKKKERKRGHPLKGPLFLCFLTYDLLVWLAGGVDELIQWWLPERVFDVRDIVFNGVTGVLGIALFATGNRKSVPSTPSNPLP